MQAHVWIAETLQKHTFKGRFSELCGSMDILLYATVVWLQRRCQGSNDSRYMLQVADNTERLDIADVVPAAGASAGLHLHSPAADGTLRVVARKASR
jgi:hypothetical protein